MGHDSINKIVVVAQCVVRVEATSQKMGTLRILNPYRQALSLKTLRSTAAVGQEGGVIHHLIRERCPD